MGWCNGGMDTTTQAVIADILFITVAAVGIGSAIGAIAAGLIWLAA